MIFSFSLDLSKIDKNLIVESKSGKKYLSLSAKNCRQNKFGKDVVVEQYNKETKTSHIVGYGKKIEYKANLVIKEKVNEISNDISNDVPF